MSFIVYQGNLLFRLTLRQGTSTRITLLTPKTHRPLLSGHEAQWSHCSHSVGVKKELIYVALRQAPLENGGPGPTVQAF